MTKSDPDVAKADVDNSAPGSAPGFFARFEAKWIVFWGASIVSLVLDQITKIWARGALPVHGRGSGASGSCLVPEDLITTISAKYKGAIICVGDPVTLIDGYWDWRLSMNPGSAFGLFGSLGSNVTRVLLSVIGIVAVVAMVYMLRKSRPDQRILHWALALVAGGAVGNLVDRIYYGMVTDFVLWKYKTHEWPVFNVADVVLVVGVGLMFIDIQKENKREKQSRQDRQAKAKKAGLVKDNL
jgi:lipoprotein signal peptidase